MQYFSWESHSIEQLRGWNMSLEECGLPKSPLQSSLLNRRRVLQTGVAAAALSGLGLQGRAAAQDATPVAALTPSDADLVAGLPAFIEATMKTYDVPGVAVTLVRDGETLFEQGFGVREIGKPETIDADTQFQLASNSKPMTAAAIGALVDAKKITFDTVVADVVTDFQLEDPYPTRFCTVRDLLAHRSGFPAFYGDVLGRLGYDRDDVIRRLRFVDTNGKFREHALYSNLGFFAAGQVLAHVHGSDWETAMTELLWAPLGLSRTNSMVEGYPSDGNYAHNHAIVDGTNTPVEWDDSIEFGAAGGVVSTAKDMGGWMKMLLASDMSSEYALLSPETRADIFADSMVAEVSFSETPPISEATGFNYGLGWGTFRLNGHVVAEKGGALGGIRTVVNLIPDLGIGVSVLVNQNLTMVPEAIRAHVLEYYLGAAGLDTQELIHAAWEQLSDVFAAAATPVEAADSVLPLDAYIGKYENDMVGEVEIVATEDGGIRLELGPARYPAALTPIGHDVFLLVFHSYTSFGENVTFTVDPTGVPTGFTTESMGSFTKVS
jgi:CubicO group peptidase (beta-lactamase class C family)